MVTDVKNKENETTEAIKDGEVHILQGLTEQEIVHVINVNKAKNEKITNDILDLSVYRALMQSKIDDLTESVGEEKFKELKESDVEELLVQDYVFRISNKEVNLVSYIDKRIRDLNGKINGKMNQANICSNMANIAIDEYKRFQSSLDDFNKGGE